jgi:hypothetical protein
MAWSNHSLFHEHPAITKGCLSLSHGRFESRPQVFWCVNPAHTSATTTGDSFRKNREANVLGRGDKHI